jgi:uncharacterized membrane protein
VPGAKLDVVGDIRGSQIIDSGLIVDTITYAGPGGQLSSNANLVFKGTNVGIGSTTPGSRLDVKGGAARILNGATVPSVDHATTAGSLYVQQDLEVDGNVYLGDAVTDNLIVVGTLTLAGSTSYTGPVTISTTNAGAFIVSRSDGTQVFNVDTQNSNVGIGTSVPGTKLDVVGDIRGSQIIDSGLIVDTITYAGPGGQLSSNANLVFKGTNVGVGTTVPGTKLDVVGDIRGSQIIDSGLIVDTITYAGPGGQLSSNANLVFNGTNVGIGSTTPGSRLDVKGGAARILNGATVPSIDHATTAGSLYVQQDLEVDGNVYLGDAVTDNLVVVGTLTLAGSTSYTGPVTISTTNAGAFIVSRSDGTQVFNVDTQNSNVGVGTSVPGTKLDVVGSIRGSQIIDSALTVDTITYAGPGGQLFGNVDFVFKGTNVGIGTTTPLSKLQVDGTLYALGAVTLGSTLAVTGNLDVNGAANDIGGTLNLSGNALTSSGVLTITPAAANNLNVVLSGAGDFTVNANQLYVDTSAGNVGIGSSTPLSKLDVTGGAARILIGDGTSSVGYATTAGSLYVR